MADSVDRVFSQCLTAVRRISRLGSARPPADVRAKLYGLYKQAMEGDVEGVVARPADPGEEQEKWDAWSEQQGLSRTEAKKHYIELLIATMHEHASEQEEGRELVAELEFVWDQIKNNSPDPTSSSSANSYGLLSPPMQAPGGYPETPLPTPGAYSQSQGGLQEVDPILQDQAAALEEQQVAAEAGLLRSPDLGAEIFVDAPESSHEAEEREEELQSAARSSEQHEDNSDRSPIREAESSTGRDERSPIDSPLSPSQSRYLLPPPAKAKAASTQTEQPLPTAPPAPQPKRTTAAALLPSLAKYLPTTSKPKPAAAPGPATSGPASPSPSTDAATAAAIAAQNKFHRRIETSLIRLTTEVTALREQLDIQAQQLSASSYSLVPRPFRSGSVSNGIGGGGKSLSVRDLLALYGKWWLSWLAGVVRHVFVDAVVVLAVWLYLRKRRGWSDERIASELVKGVTAVAAVFGPVKGAWDGARARMPVVPGVRLPRLGMRWAVEWVKSWGAVVAPGRYRAGLLRRKESPAG